MASAPVQAHVQTIADIHREAMSNLGAHQRGVERLTAWLGRPRTLYVVVAVVVGWCIANVTSAHAWDPPPFPLLQGLVSAAALITSTVVLITQHRMSRHGERRGQLDLHINLLAEQRTAKLIGLLEELRRDLPSVANRHDAEAEALQEPADARDVLAILEETIDTA